MESVLNWRGLLMAVPLVALVLLMAWLFARGSKKRRQKPGQRMRYTVPGKTAAACRGLLGDNPGSDLFAYTLEAAQNGGWYLRFTRHNPTGQPLDTLFLLQFEGDTPAVMNLSFVREAFGMREPIIGEALLDAFFENKVGAQRVDTDVSVMRP